MKKSKPEAPQYHEAYIITSPNGWPVNYTFHAVDISGSDNARDIRTDYHQAKIMSIVALTKAMGGQSWSDFYAMGYRDTLFKCRPAGEGGLNHAKANRMD